MSDTVRSDDHQIIGIQTTASITETMIQTAYGKAVEWIRNMDVPTHLSDEQLQVFMRSLAEQLADAERGVTPAADDPIP